MQESLSLPVPVCYPGDTQKDDPGETKDVFKTAAELSSSPSLSTSVGDSVESSGSPLSSPKDTSSTHSPSGFMRNVKKRESKGKGKEPKGLQDQNVMVVIAVAHCVLTEPHNCFLLQRSQTRPRQLANLKEDFQILGKSLSRSLLFDFKLQLLMHRQQKCYWLSTEGSGSQVAKEKNMTRRQ